MTEIATREDFLALNAKLDMILETLGINPRVVTIKDIAKRYNCSYTHLKYTAPYMLPNNGKSEFNGVIKWTMDTLLAWEAIPVSERKSNWENQMREEARQKLANRK